MDLTDWKTAPDEFDFDEEEGEENERIFTKSESGQPETIKVKEEDFENKVEQVRKLNWIAELSLLCNVNFIIFI